MSASYASALEIISDAAAELGLGVISDAYGSSDANVIQLRTILKSAGRKLVFDRDWNHLTREFGFVTREAWAKTTAYISGLTGSDSWQAGNPQGVGDAVYSNGNTWRCITGSLTGTGALAPSGITSDFNDGVCHWKTTNIATASEVYNGAYYYICTQSGISASATGPQGTTLGAIESDGTVKWKNAGRASDYQDPAGFSNMIDQTGWNRTNRLPLGGPVSAQVWEYLKGRQQGVVFNVLFRDVRGVFRLYPDTNPPSGYHISFQYITSYWASPAAGLSPSQESPLLNTDIVYFDPLLMNRRLKLDWLRAKGFPTDAVQVEYDDALEVVKNADGSAPILSLNGRSAGDPLLGPWNVPITGFGS